MQGVAASMALWLAVAVGRALPWPHPGDWRGGLSTFVTSIAARLPDLSTVVTFLPGTLLFVLLAAWLMLAPVAIYFAVHDE
jgi:hypothetical protein